MQTVGMASATALAMILISAPSSVIQSQDRGQQPVTETVPGFTVPSGQKFILQLETEIHTRTARKGDRIEFSTAADVALEDQVIVPNKSRVTGTVTMAKRAGRLSGKAAVQLRLDEIQLADASVVPLHATIIRVGFDPVDPAKGGDPTLKGDSGSIVDIGTIVKTGAQGAIIGLRNGVRGAEIGSIVFGVITALQMVIQRGPDLDLTRYTLFEARFDQALNVPVAAVRPRPAPQTPPAEAAAASAASPPDRPAPQRPRLTRAVEPPIADKPPVTIGADTRPTGSVPPVREPSKPAAGSYSLRVYVRMVQVDAVVKDRKGRMMENLTHEDFIIFEDGIRQEVRSFSRNELPLAVAIVIDRSGSVAPYLQELRRIAEHTLQELKPEDEVALFSFASDVVRIEDLSTDRRRIADAIDAIQAGGGTDIVDALYDSAKYLAQAAPDRRRAIILISDNQPTVDPIASEAEALRVAMESETVVYSIKTKGAVPILATQIPNLIAGSNPVTKIAQETGGEIIKAGSLGEFSTAMSSVIARLRLRYCLGYYPSGGNQGTFHSIVVRLDERLGKPGSDYFIHARRGYYATADRR